MIKLSDYVIKRLKEKYNVQRVYMIPGGGAMHLNDSIGQYIPYVCNHHEQGCAFAAEGQARYTNDLAVVCTTSGPGALNAVTGVFGQWTDSVPVLYISGQIKRQTLMATYPELKIRQIGDQEVDIISVVKSITKYAVCVTKPEEIRYHLDRAIYEATNGRRGPVWLDIPLDVQGMPVDENNLIDFIPPENEKYDLKIDEVTEKLQNSKRPLIVAGYGVRISEQISLLKKFVSDYNLPLVTTFNGVDIIEDNNPNYTGRIGTVGQRAGNFALQNSDCILFLGTRNNIRQASYNWEAFGDKAFKIVVDIDKAELEKPTVKPDLGVNADLKEFLPELCRQNIKFNPDPEWLDFCKKLKEKYDFYHTEAYKQKTKVINPYHFFRRLFETAPEQSAIVTGNGTACVVSYQTGLIKKGTRLFYNSGNATMGFDLPAAIGVSCSDNKREVIVITGDGSIMMNLQELQTIKNLNLPIKIFVINNDGYISMKQTQGNFFNGRLTAADSSSGVICPDFVKLAKGFGIKGVKISKPSEIDKKIKKVLTYKEPVICEVMTEKNYIFQPKLSSKKLEDGTMVSSRLEDMFPFLDREEFKENMIDGQKGMQMAE